MEATADQIGIALDNARLYSETLRQLEELKRTQAQLVHAEKLSAVGELASGVAHEINNPLTTILGQAHLLLDHADVTPHVRDRLTIVADEAARAARIVQNLLLFRAALPAGAAAVLAGRPGPPRARAQGLSARAGQDPRRDGLRVVPPVWADENQIQQVLLNLVQNAHQAMVKHDRRAARPCASGRRRHGCAWRCSTRAPASRPTPCRGCSIPSSRPSRRARAAASGLSVSYGIVTEHKGRLRGENRDRPARRDLHRRAAGGRGGLSVRSAGARAARAALALVLGLLAVGCTGGVGGPVAGRARPPSPARLRQRQSRLRPAALLDADHVLHPAHVGGDL